MKKIILSLVVITAVAAIAGAATYSYYSDKGTVKGSTLSAGTMDLKIDKNVSGGTQEWVDNFDSPIALSDLKPDYLRKQIVDIQKQGSVDGTASIRLVLTSNQENSLLNPEVAVGDNAAGDGNWNGELAQNMRIKISYSPGNDGNFTEKYDYTLAEFAANPNQLDLGEITGTDKIASVKLEWSIPASVGNDIMSDSVTVDTIFGLEQEVN